MTDGTQLEIVGLFPAGGQATRIAPLPCSKELYPLGFRSEGEGAGLRPKVVCHYLLERMRLAGITQVYVIIRQGKWDIPAYLGDGTMLDMHLAYLMMNLPFGVPYTLDQAYPFVQDKLIALGFPDIIFQPDDAFQRLLAQQARSKADIVLGIFPTDQPHTTDMVDFDADGRVHRIVIKPRQTDLQFTWMIAVWTPDFTHFMHEYLISVQQELNQPDLGNQKAASPELYIGDVFQVAIDNGMSVDTVLFPNGT
ncbi:MAG: dTDP-glucose pyrophosphorylase, partial [Anaerolineae bacterium]|nr:dTDP-glucose pyrophosphorylase [Anaerolineae bacterium]